MKNLAGLLFATFLSILSCRSQDFKINERKILSNANLDYYLKALKNEQFTPLVKRRDIPDFIKEQLPWINDKEMADIGQKYQATDVIQDENLPWRRLLFACNNKHVLVVTYVHGGFGTNYKILFVRYADRRVKDVWIGTTFCNDLVSVTNILRCIQENRNKKWGLNTNFVSM